MGVGQQHVQAALHQQVKHPDASHAAQVQQGETVVIGVGAQFTHADEFGAERQYAAFGQVETAGLHVIHGLATGVVAIGIEHSRHLAPQTCWFVEQGRDPQAWVPFVAQFADVIALARLDHLPPLDPGLGFQQLGVVAPEEQFEQLAPGLGGAAQPDVAGGWCSQAGQQTTQEGEQLPVCFPAENFLVERALHERSPNRH